MLNFIKIVCEVLILLIPIFFALPQDSFIYDYQFISSKIEQIRFVLIVVLALSIGIRYSIEYRNFKLKKENERLREAVKSFRSFISGSVNLKVKEIFENLNLNEQYRITVFLYSSSLDKFFSIGRYSSAPKFNEIGRYVIDDKQEYVYQVLNDDNHHKNAPEVKNGLFKKRVMQSKSMFGVSLWDDKHMNKIGVVVFQSMKENAYKSKETRTNCIKEILNINTLINEMKIDPNSIASANSTIRGF